MKIIGAIAAAAFAFALAVQFASAQDGAAQGEHVKSAWVRATVSGEGQPKGYVQYQDYCSMCHGEGPGRPGTMALRAKYKGAEPALLADRTDLTPALIKAYVRNGVSIMPIFRKTEISDADLDAIAAYLTRNNKH
ncbi:MAG TPA: cytochrome c [Candidatus Acidoferrales bacterium]|jgi:mono/diheme cytochrome c family protein|nr:cytochrome c [Candidatus Acidoferrales bacterium]